MNFDVKEALTLSIAVLGAALGVLNSWRAWNTDRVRLRVRCVFAVLPNSSQTVGIEVTNLSTFAVTVEDIGWTIRGSDRRMAIITPIFFRNESLPMRLEPRTAFTGYAAPGTHQNFDFSAVGKVYAKTACGVTRKQSSGLLRDLVKRSTAGI